MSGLTLGFVCGLLATLLLLPPLARRFRHLDLPRPDALATGLLLGIWPAARFLGPSPASPLEMGLMAAGPVILLGTLSRSPVSVPRATAAWLAAGLVLVWYGVGVDLERFRDGWLNPAMTLLFLGTVGGGLATAEGSGEPARATGPLLIVCSSLIVVSGVTEQQQVAALAIPLLGICIALHLQLLPPADLEAPAPAIAICGLALAALTLWARFSDASRLGALAAPLLWALPAGWLLLRLLGRLPRHRPTAEMLVALGLGFCAAGLVVGPITARWSAALGLALAGGWWAHAALRPQA